MKTCSLYKKLDILGLGDLVCYLKKTGIPVHEQAVITASTTDDAVVLSKVPKDKLIVRFHTISNTGTSEIQEYTPDNSVFTKNANGTVSFVPDDVTGITDGTIYINYYV